MVLYSQNSERRLYSKIRNDYDHSFTIVLYIIAVLVANQG